MNKAVTLRSVKNEDRDLLFRWVNDVECRRYAFQTQPIDYETHCRWFLEKMNNRKTKIFILTDEIKDIGQIRIEIRQGEALISYSIDTRFRGMGYGTKMVKLLEEWCVDNGIFELTAEVKKDNHLSRHIFLKLGFSEKEKPGYFRYEKSLKMKAEGERNEIVKCSSTLL